MRRLSDVSPALVADLRAKGADLERTLVVLDLLTRNTDEPDMRRKRS
jgi:hypothetical protein